MQETTEQHRAIRSFVLRQGRLTKGQESAMQSLWPQFGIEAADTELKLAHLFGRTAPITLEIGFGTGVSLLPMAQAKPKRN